jgi:holo-[acyl-carrier protein] synthase
MVGLSHRAWCLDTAALHANDRLMPIELGLDLVSVAAVAESLHGPQGGRYLARVYTEREVDDCRKGSGIDPRRLAARFAAKEAVLKLLVGADDAVSLRDVEVHQDETGRVRIALLGRAAELAREAGVVEISVSVTHDRAFAAAAAVADRIAPSR